MGTWGTNTLENDSALDELDAWFRVIDEWNNEDVKEMVVELLNTDALDLCLLGIKMVEISINKGTFDDFTPIEEYEMEYNTLLRKLHEIDFDQETINLAIKRIEFVQKEDTMVRWATKIYNDRKKYVNDILTTLKSKIV